MKNLRSFVEQLTAEENVELVQLLVEVMPGSDLRQAIVDCMSEDEQEDLLYRLDEKFGLLDDYDA
jgi:hypothetical protein